MDERRMPLYEALYLLAVCHDRQGRPAVPEAFLAGMKRRVSDAVEQEEVFPRLGGTTESRAGAGGEPL